MKRWMIITLLVTAALGLSLVGLARAQSGAWPFGAAGEAAQIQQQLAQATDPTARALLEGKLQILAGEQQAALDAKSAGAKNGPSLCASLPADAKDAEPLESGIFSVDADQLPGTGLTPVNAWQGQVGGEWAVVTAAARGNEGVLVMQYLNRGGGGQFAAPSGSGVLRIAAEDGGRLVLESEAGQPYWFSLAAEQFVTEDEQVTPLAPQPTFTPLAPVCP